MTEGFDWHFIGVLAFALFWAMTCGLALGVGAALQYARRRAVTFMQIIEHGDATHKTWLWNAAIDFWKIERPKRGLTEIPADE